MKSCGIYYLYDISSNLSRFFSSSCSKSLQFCQFIEVLSRFYLTNFSFKIRLNFDNADDGDDCRLILIVYIGSSRNADNGIVMCVGFVMYIDFYTTSTCLNLICVIPFCTFNYSFIRFGFLRCNFISIHILSSAIIDVFTIKFELDIECNRFIFVLF